MKEVVILGGGFGGIAAALRLRILHLKDVNVTLIDKNSYHLFTPSLYEVATSEEPNKNIAIPYSQIFSEDMKFVQGAISNIDIQNHAIFLTNESSYTYDFLIIALGSQPSFFDIEGLKNYSIPLKTLEDSVKIREKIEEEYHKKAQVGKKINIVVGGGGFSGTELTAELINYRKKLSYHYKLPEDLVKISVIQGSQTLLKELDEKVSKIAQKRLEKHNIEIILGAHIKKVEKDEIETDDGKKYPYDVLIWTGGVKANSVLAESGFKTNGRGQVTVNEYMQVLNYSNVFAVGDIAEFANPINNKPAPGVAEVAQDQGEIAAENIYRKIDNKDLMVYHYLHVGYIIPLRGRFAVADFSKIRIVGFLGWVIQQFVFLYYLLKILPITKAFRKWNKFEMYLIHS